MTEDWMKRWAVFSMALAVGLFGSFPAWSQVAAELPRLAATTVDASPFALNAINAAVLILTGIAGFVSKFAVGWLSAKTRLSDKQLEALLAARVHDIMTMAINYAETQAKAAVSDPNSSVRSVRVDNIFIGWVVEYAQKSMPDLITYFGLTRQRIEDMAKARLNAYIAPPAEDAGKLTLITSPDMAPVSGVIPLPA